VPRINHDGAHLATGGRVIPRTQQGPQQGLGVDAGHAQTPLHQQYRIAQEKSAAVVADFPFVGFEFQGVPGIGETVAMRDVAGLPR